ncbi:MAG TPA: YciI family protein [Candidatus Saccharimonadales bacterium]|nr:YciI family protein [Candidatus Saccharimonadales bacterium]
MKTFLVLLSEKQPHLLNDYMLKSHIDFLKQLRVENLLPICGPFTDNNGAVLIIKADDLHKAEEIVKKDPFISQKYYQKYSINEFLAAGEENNWLSDVKQTKDNLQKKL